MKLQTPIEIQKSKSPITYNNKILSIGSCFAENIGQKMSECGFDICSNPFGTLYNPVSICNAIARITSAVPFTEDECIEMGAGAGKICSFSHHTSFARANKQDFLDVANRKLTDVSEFWKQTDTVIITLGTAWVYKYEKTGEIVSNCLKINANEFTREMLSVNGIVLLFTQMLSKNQNKKFIFTVSPIRHLKNGAHGNQISKSTLLLAVEQLCNTFSVQCEYFPAYEIMIDELRDYRFYAEDMLHPSNQAISYIFDCFTDFILDEKEKNKLLQKMKEFKQSLHRNILQ